MRNFQKGGKLKHVMQSKPFLIFWGVIILAFIFSIFGFMSKMEETIKNKKIVEDKIAELEKSKEKLSSDITSLQTQEGVEENIRDKFGLAKDGENMIMITDDKSVPETNTNADSGGFLNFFKNLFK